MAFNFQGLGKIFSMGVLSRAVQAFDRATMAIVVTSWSAALLMMLGAVYTLSLSVTAKREAIAAAAMEPALPNMKNKAPVLAELQPLVDRMKLRFSDINFQLSGDMSLTVSTNDGSRFRTWLTVLSYIDTISPQYRWTMKEFCVGAKCGSSTLMKAIVAPEKITFVQPAQKK